jgi:hypothetical protein
MKKVLPFMILSLMAPGVLQAMHLCPGDRVPQLLQMGYPWPLVQQHCSQGTPLPPLQGPPQPQQQWSQPPPQGQWPPPSPQGQPPPSQWSQPQQWSQPPPQGQWPPPSPQGQPPPPSQWSQPQQQWSQPPPQGQASGPPPLPQRGGQVPITRTDGSQVAIQSPQCTRAMVMELLRYGIAQQEVQEIIGRMCGGQLRD